jgi:excisionase family DNA binding protein
VTASAIPAPSTHAMVRARVAQTRLARTGDRRCQPPGLPTASTVLVADQQAREPPRPVSFTGLKGVLMCAQPRDSQPINDNHDDASVDAGRTDFSTLQTYPESGSPSEHPDALIDSLMKLTNAIRDLVARSPVSSEELLTAEQLGDLFRLSPRTLRDLAAAGLVPHHRIGKHYRFSRDDIAEILHATKQILKHRQSSRRAA